MTENSRTPSNIVDQIFAELGISLDHPEPCQREAQAWHDTPGFDDPALTDWTTIPFVTIDNADSRDLDQALHIERDGTGFRLRYALADAAFYVRPGSALFDEALNRGTTFYTPLVAAPMLPRSLSEGLLSLNPRVNRRALVFDMQLNQDASEVTTSITRALIHSQAKLSYAGVQRSLDASTDDTTTASTSEYTTSLLLLAELGELLIQRGLERGVVPFDRRESDVSVSEDTASNAPEFQLTVRDRLGTERYNEQLSLLCNMEGAALLQESLNNEAPHESQPVFRVHDAPLKARRRQLEVILNELVELRGLDEQWRLKPDQTLADYVSGLHHSTGQKSLYRAVQRQILMSQRASTFTEEPGLHYALAAPEYARFSSPMREIVGIFTHKELLEILKLQPAQQTSEQDDELREAVIESANRAKQTQRKIEKRIEFQVIDKLLRDDLSRESPSRRSGTLMGIRDKRLYVQLDELSLDLKVYLQDLESEHDCAYQLSNVEALPDRQGAPRFRIGDAVTLSTQRWDNTRQRFVLNLGLATAA